MIVPPRHPAGQGSGTTATRARGGPGGLPTEDLASLSVSKKLSHGSPLAAGCQAALCPGATALSRLWAQALRHWGSAVGAWRPCLLEEETRCSLPSQGQGLEQEPQT